MKINKRTIAVSLITILFVFLAFKDMQFGEFAKSIHEINYKTIWLIIPVLIVSMYARGIRLDYLLSQKSGLSISELTGVCFAGSALNICLPARREIFSEPIISEQKTARTRSKSLVLLYWSVFSTDFAYSVFCLSE